MRDGPFHLFWAEDTPNQSVMEPWYYKYLGEHGRDIINVIAFQIKLAWVTAVVSFTYFIPSALMLIRDYGIVDNVAALCGVNRFYLLNVVFIVVNGWSILPERGPHLWFAYGNSFFMLLFYSIIPFIFNENDYPFISDLITTKAPSDQQKVCTRCMHLYLTLSGHMFIFNCNVLYQWYLLSIMLITSTITGWIVAPVTSPRDPNTHLVRHIISKARTQCYFSIWQCHKMFLIVGIVQIANNKDLSDTSRVLTFGIGFSVTKFIILRLMGKVLEKYKDLIPKGTIVDEEVERKTKEVSDFATLTKLVAPAHLNSLHYMMKHILTTSDLLYIYGRASLSCSLSRMCFLISFLLTPSSNVRVTTRSLPSSSSSMQLYQSLHG